MSWMLNINSSAFLKWSFFVHRTIGISHSPWLGERIRCVQMLQFLKCVNQVLLSASQCTVTIRNTFTASQFLFLAIHQSWIIGHWPPINDHYQIPELKHFGNLFAFNNKMTCFFNPIKRFYIGQQNDKWVTLCEFYALVYIINWN